MNYLFTIIYAFVFFIVSQIIHILIWRNNRLLSPWLTLVVIFIIVPPMLVLFLYFLENNWSLLQYLPKFTLSEWLAAYLFHGAMGGGYFFLYPTAQDGSPAVRLSLYLHANMPEGLTLEELKEYLLSRDDMGPRINDLLVSGYIEKSKDGALRLTRLGRIFIRPFLMLRQLLGLKPGEG
jgi:hypothetical protein